MKTHCLAIAVALAATLPSSASAQTATAPALASVTPSIADSAVEAFYAARNQAPLWLKDESSRAAARAFAVILRDSDLDGLADAKALKANVEAAIARGQPEDDKAISVAWVRFVQALKGPLQGVNYGDLSLTPKVPAAAAILAQAGSAPTLSDHVTAVAAVNPFYAALRDAAVKQGATADPHVRASLSRLRLIPVKGRIIVVDVANAQLMMLEDGRVVDTMKVIVGKQANPTPLIASSIYYVTFNPYWHIPHDVAQRKVAPIVIKRGVSYLKAARYETVAAFGKGEDPIDPVSVDWKAVADGSARVNIRQLSGPNNMMGAMKFGFANDYGIYLHDTPHKDLFAKAKRNLSLGCIRVEHPAALAQWLLRRDPVPPSADVELQVPLDGGVPIFVSYLTARADGDRIAYADDVYGLDAIGSAKQKMAVAENGDAAAQ